MLGDWFLTLLVLSPAFLALLLVLFVLVGRISRHERMHPMLVDRLHHDGGLQ